jgi:hypothetical protein
MLVNVQRNTLAFLPYQKDVMLPRSLCGSLPLLLILAGALPGCAEHPHPGLDPVTGDSVGVLVQEFPEGVLEDPAPFRLAENPEVRIGVLEGASEYQWTRPVAATRLSDGGFAVLEQAPAEIRLFDPSGQFVRRIGVEGDGPGELRSPVGLVALPGDTLLVWDRGSRRLTWFSAGGEMVRERTLRDPGGIQTHRRVTLSGSGVVSVLGATTTEEELGNQGRVRERWDVVPVLPDADPGSAVGTIPGIEREIEMDRSASGDLVSIRVRGRWWWGDGFAWASEDGVWTADPLALEARHFDPERGLDRIVRILAEDRPFTRTLIDSLHTVELDRVDDPEVRELWRADFQEREYPQGMPPVASIFSDVAHRVWIGRTEPPPYRLPSGEWTAVRRWLLFEAGMPHDPEETEPLAWVGTLTLPPRSHPLWADGEGVLLVRIDEEFDVAYIEWYPFVSR